MPPDLTVTLAGVIFAVAALGYWFGRSGSGSERLNWRFQEFTERLPKRSEKAVEAYLREAEKERLQPAAAFELATYFRSVGDWRRALQIHESLAAREDLDAGARAQAGLEIGDDYRSAGMLDRAAEAYAGIVEYRPLRLEALHRGLGICEQLQDWQQAVRIAAQVAEDDPSAGGNLRCHYLCELAAEQARAGDLKQAAKLLKQAAKASRTCPRPRIEQALSSEEGLDAALAAVARHPECAELILAGLAAEENPDPRVLERGLSDLLKKNPGLGKQMATALLMTPDLLCQTTAACLFETLRHSYPSYASAYAARLPEEFSARDLTALSAELHKATGGPPRWRCATCGQEQEAHFWRCVECGSWDSARLISPFSA